MPHGHWQTLTFVVALRCDRIDAPCVFDGPINAKSFLAYVTHSLVPTLKPRDVVVMDNPSSHKGAAIRKAICTTGARLLLLPAYSPDLTPIEQVFAKLKHLMRKAAERRVEARLKLSGQLLDCFPPDECSQYLVKLGYASNQRHPALADPSAPQHERSEAELTGLKIYRPQPAVRRNNSCSAFQTTSLSISVWRAIHCR